MTRAVPLLVTGLPRSGTTWTARQLTRAPGLALAGREPMNPRTRQFALGGTLTGWSRLGDGTSDEQRRLLRRVYRGLEPRVYSRYGVRQWSAPLRSTRLVVKDPFALLSLPLITEVTHARPVVLFRHPGALLASYRRMGWTPAVAEIDRLGLAGPAGAAADPDCPDDELGAMTRFWTACYARVLDDLADLPQALLVEHTELARGGDTALRRLLTACGMPTSIRLARVPGRPRRPRHRAGAGTRPVLHDFDRTPEEVALGWRRSFTDAELVRLLRSTQPTWEALHARRLRLDVDQAAPPGAGTERR